MGFRHARTFRMGRLLATGVLVLSTTGPAAVAAASGNPQPDVEFERVVTDLLAELGVEPQTGEVVSSDLGPGIGRRLTAMIDAGVLTAEQIESTADLLRQGDFAERVRGVVVETRVRRDAFRVASVEALNQLGVDIDPRQSVAEVLEANGLTISDLVEVLETLGTGLPTAPFVPLAPPGGGDRLLDPGAPVGDAITPTVPLDEPPLPSTPGAAPADLLPTPPGIEDLDKPPVSPEPPKPPLPPRPPLPPPTLAPVPSLPTPTLAPVPSLPPPTLAPPGDHEHDETLSDFDRPVPDHPPLL